jgi:hypothetical protein
MTKSSTPTIDEAGAGPAAGRRRRWRVGAVLIVGVLLAAGCSLTNAGLQGQTLTAIDAQEESFFSNGDEPYVAVIQFRVTPGIAGSTQVRFLGNLAEIATHIDDGDSATIPAAMAATSFPNVLTAGLSDIIAGRSPEIVGAVTVAMESDASPWSAINGIMNDVTNELDAQLRAHIEPLSFSQILDPATAADRLAEAARRVEAAATPSFWRGVGIWFSSFGDPDDVIGFKVLFLVGVTGDLADTVDAKLASGLPDAVVGRALRPGPLDVDYSGDGATYRIRWNVTTS